jgi:hypothetical protein
MRTKVQEGLRFCITDFLDSNQLQGMIRTWSSFIHSNSSIIENKDNEDQSTLVHTFIDTNISGKASVGQKFLFGKLKDLPSPSRPTTLESAFEFVLSEFRDIRKSCQTAYSVGYRMSSSFQDTHTNTIHKKHTPTRVTGTPQSTAKSTDFVRVPGTKTVKPSLKTPSSVSNTVCKGCGVSGHPQAECVRKEHPYFNAEACEFKDSTKWTALQKAYPRLIEATPTNPQQSYACYSG